MPLEGCSQLWCFLRLNSLGLPKVYLLQSPGTSEETCYICKVIPDRKSHSGLRVYLAHPGDEHIFHLIHHLGYRRENYKAIRHSPPQLSLVTQSCLTLCDPMDCSTLGFPVHYQHPELAQTHVHRVGDAIQPSHPL